MALLCSVIIQGQLQHSNQPGNVQKDIASIGKAISKTKYVPGALNPTVKFKLCLSSHKLERRLH